MERYEQLKQIDRTHTCRSQQQNRQYVTQLRGYSLDGVTGSEEGIYEIDIEIAENQAPEDTIESEEHPDKNRKQQEAPFVKAPVEQCVALSLCSDSIEIHILKANRKAAHTHDLKIRRA